MGRKRKLDKPVRNGDLRQRILWLEQQYIDRSECGKSTPWEIHDGIRMVREMMDEIDAGITPLPQDWQDGKTTNVLHAAQP